MPTRNVNLTNELDQFVAARDRQAAGACTADMRSGPAELFRVAPVN